MKLPRRRGVPVSAEQQLLKTATVRIAAQFALAVVLLLTVVGTVLYALDRQAASSSALDTLRQATALLDDVEDPPAGVLLVRRTADGQVQATAGTPAAAASGALLGRPDGLSDFTDDDGESYRVLTRQRTDGVRVQALYDTRREAQERQRLLTALLLSDGLGALAAAGVGALLARRAIRPLSDALALQRRFVADASHELRAPLTLLHTRAQLLDRALLAHEQIQPDQTAALVRDTRVLSEVVEDLLASAELSHRPAERQVVDLTALAADVAESFMPLADQAGVHLSATTTTPVLVTGTPAALRRALTALIDNALAHTRPGDSITVHVDTAFARNRTWARLAVRDTGTGLDPGHADALFDRFARGENVHGTARRFGLGLALVRDVVTAHDGRIHVEGAPGHGATFLLLLPAATVTTTDPFLVRLS